MAQFCEHWDKNQCTNRACRYYSDKHVGNCKYNDISEEFRRELLKEMELEERGGKQIR